MNEKKYAKLIFLIFFIAISNILIFQYCNLENNNVTVSYKLISDKADTYQLFYGNDVSWSEERSEKVNYSDTRKEKKVKFVIPENVTEIRFDLGSEPSHMELSDIKLEFLGRSVNLDINEILDKNNQVQIGKIEQVGNYLEVETIGNDAYITYKIEPDIQLNIIKSKNIMNNLLKFIICIFLDMAMLIFFKKSRSVLLLAQEINNNRTLIWNLSKNDFRTKYAGSYLGIVWAFVQPIVTILVYWFVFEFGLKSGSPIKDVPFILWFMTGLVPWFFFQESVTNATNCMLEYSYLVKKVLFKISILPIVKIISALFVHLVFIGFLFIVGSIYGFYPSVYTIQLAYYSFCTFFLVLAISYATSAIIIFFKDLGQIINIFLQIGMWMTPIMWSYTIMPKQLQWIVKLNPMYYIVEGYRDAVINNVWFFERYFQTAYFWIITLSIFVVGAIIFKKLKPHFADVL